MLADLVMWSKRGPKGYILSRINKVVPPEVVKQKILVIDSLNDLTVSPDVFKHYGWQLHLNDGVGIGGAANTALDCVESEFFASFEDDLLLAADWFSKMSKLMELPNVAIASGVRFVSAPNSIHQLEASGCLKETKKNPLQTSVGKTLDNTLYRTAIMKEMGFARTKTGSGIDTVLSFEIEKKGYHWLVDYSAVSVHLKTNDLLSHLQRYAWYGKALRELRSYLSTQKHPKMDNKFFIFRVLKAIPSGFLYAYLRRTPSIAYTYPLVRLAYFIGWVQGAKYE
jgi:hypothetical protein